MEGDTSDRGQSDNGQIEKTQTVEEFNNFIVEHGHQIESIGGKDGELIEQVKKDHVLKLSK